MKIKSLREYQTGQIRHKAGDVYEEKDITAKTLIKKGLAKEAEAPEQKEDKPAKTRKKKVQKDVENRETK